MVRQVLFSFHHKRDVMRAAIVRNSGMTQQVPGFIDSANWEKIKRQGDEATKRWINNQLDGTSVTVVLIGAETHNRRWVKYELIQSWLKNNGILGIYIHSIRDPNTGTDVKGTNSLGDNFYRNPDDGKKYFWQRFNTYDWTDDDGRNNLSDWIERAAREAGR